jgi:hypothetical protein
MSTRFGTSWRLVKSSFVFLVANTDLLLYPIVMVVLSALALVLGTLGVLLWADFDISILMELPWQQRTALTFVFYVGTYCIAIYTNTALVTTVLQIMDGETPDMAAAWREATQRLPAIVGYAMIMATIGMALRLILRPLGMAGRLAAPALQRVVVFTVMGLAWHLVPYFVIPVMIAEKAGPFQAIRQSSALIKRVWGDDVVVNASVWLIFALPLVIVLLLGGPTIVWAIATGGEFRVMVTVYVVVMLILVTLLLKLAMDGVFAAATYRFATTGATSAWFGESDLRQAFRNRPSRIANRFRRIFGRRAPQPAPQTAQGELADGRDQ